MAELTLSPVSYERHTGSEFKGAYGCKLPKNVVIHLTGEEFSLEATLLVVTAKKIVVATTTAQFGVVGDNASMVLSDIRFCKMKIEQKGGQTTLFVSDSENELPYTLEASYPLQNLDGWQPIGLGNPQKSEGRGSRLVPLGVALLLALLVSGVAFAYHKNVWPFSHELPTT